MLRQYLNFQKTNRATVCVVWLWYRNIHYPRAMDTLLHSPSSMAKRPCPSQNPRIQNPNPSPNPDPDPDPTPMEMDMDELLETLLFRHSSTSSQSVDRSFERLLVSRASDSDQNELIDRALGLGTLLLEAGKRSARKRASKHNSLAWALPPDLTIKVGTFFVAFFFFFLIFRNIIVLEDRV